MRVAKRLPISSRELGRELLAQETRHLLGLDREHRLAREALIHGRERGLGAKHQVHGVLHLHQAPVVALSEGIEHRTEAPGVAIQPAVQLIGGERIGDGLRALDVGDAHKGVVGEREIDASGGEFPRQPGVAVAVELQPERTPRRHPQVTQPERLVDEVEVVVQALARVGFEEGLAARLVVPGFVARAGLHRRDHVHQARRIAPARQHLRHHVLLADVGLVEVLDLDPGRGTNLLGAGADAISKRFGKTRIVKDPDSPGIQKARHPLRVTRPRQRPRDHNPVVARQHAQEPIAISLRQHLRHRRLRSRGRVAANLTCLVPAMPA